MANREKNSESKLVKILIFFLTISLIANVYLFIKRTEVFPSKKELMLENKNLDDQLILYKNELYKFKGINTDIDRVINDAQVKIEAKENLIAGLMREKKWEAKKNQKLLFEIDSLKEQYLNVIDSLLVEREGRNVINSKIGTLEELMAGLNKKIGIASQLLGDNIKVSPLKTSLAGKMKSTAFAKKTDEIKICIDILENRIAKPGIKNIYFVITTPDAKILVDGAGEAPKFQHPDFKKPAECSKIEPIDYTNQKINLCTTIKPGKIENTGLYVLEVFSDETKLGMTTFSLK